MSMLVRDVIEWLNGQDPGHSVGVDEGGLTLLVEELPEEYLEIGGVEGR